MLSKRLAILVALAITPALAQVQSTPAPEALKAVLQSIRDNAPMRFKGRLSDGTVSSDNWSGYAVKGTAFTSAKGSWFVSKGDCSKTPGGYAVVWVGIDGYSDTTVEQDGTLLFCNGTTAEYYGWYEFYPAESIQLIPSFAVKPGNKMFGEISYNGTEFTLTLTNETTGKTFKKTGKVSAAKRSSAEFIVEAPSTSTGVLPLADFGTESLGDDHTDIADTNWASDKSVTGPISDFKTSVEKITMVNTTTKAVEAAPSALSTDGSSFTVTWKSE